MLQSLSIRHFKALESLDLQGLARINLLVGKNNVGKSTVLEALAIVASQVGHEFVRNLVIRMGEKPDKIESDFPTRLLRNEEAIETLFLNRDKTSPIRIDYQENGVNKSLEMHFVRYQLIIESDPNDPLKALDFRTQPITAPLPPLPEGTFGNRTISQPLSGLAIVFPHRKADKIIGLDDKFWLLQEEKDSDSIPYQFVEGVFFREDKSNLRKLWENFALTEEEGLLIRALQFIDPEVESITFKNGADNTRPIPYVKVARFARPVPIQSMGDGINWVMAIMLGLLNAENGILLIDEMENGLHHSIQEQLWKMIFQVAVQKNVQVFATTHSDDCVMSFESVLAEKEHADLGKLIRLEKRKGKFQQVEFDAKRLELAAQYNVEIR